MKPLIITADLAGPLIDNSDPIHLDSLLALAWAIRHDMPPVHRRTKAAEIEAPHLPLVKLSALGAACWAATAGAMVSPISPAAVWQTSRRDPEDWDRLARPVSVASGPRKDRLIRRAAVVASAIRWYAWGDRREVVRSLRLVLGRESAPTGFLGSVRRSGSGEVTAWRVEIGQHDLERCYLAGDQPARHLPHEWVESCSRWRLGATMPPYWLPDHQRRTPHLGASVMLHPEPMQAMSC